MRRLGVGLGAVLMGLIGMGPGVEARTVAPPPADPAGWVIESADYLGEIEQQIVRLDARYTIRTLRDGWTEIPLAIPGATVTGIEIEKKSGEAHIMPYGNTYVLAATRKGTFRIRVRCSSPLQQDSQYEGLSVGIPRATFSTLVLSVSRKDVELREMDRLYVEQAGAGDGVKLTARLGAADRIDLRWRTKPATPEHVDPVLYGEVHTLVTIEEQLARIVSVIGYRMAQGETNELVVRLPVGLNVLNVRGAGIEDWRVADDAGHKTLKVVLGAALKDATYQLILEGEEAIKEGETAYGLPEITLIGVKQERGYVAIARTGSVELSAATTEGVHRIDVKELPTTFGSLSGDAPPLAFKYHQHPYRLAVGMTRYQDHAVLSAIAEVGQLETVMDRSGTMLTRATYLIQANKKQFLEVILPKEATLWGCTVNGKSVKPVQGGEGQLLVPLDAVANSATSSSVELVYFEQRPTFEWTGAMALHGPVLDVPVTISNWSVYAPSEVKLFRLRGNMERGAAAVTFLGEPVEVASASISYKNEARLADVRSKMLDFVGRAVGGGMKSNADSIGNQFSSNGRWEKHARYATVDRALIAEQEAVWDDEGYFNANRQDGASGPVNLAKSVPPPSVPPTEEDYKAVRERFAARLQETGVLPLKIRLPQSGHAYRFNRMMTTTEALRLEGSFVHVRMPFAPLAALGLLLFPIGGFALVRFRLL